MKKLQSGRGMIEVIVVAGLLLVGVLVFVNGGFTKLTGGAETQRKDGVGQTVVGKALARGKDGVCIQQVKQVREAIEIANDPVENTHPASLSELNLGDKLIHCPIGNELYEYDPATGTVKCPHPGHEKY